MAVRRSARGGGVQSGNEKAVLLAVPILAVVGGYIAFMLAAPADCLVKGPGTETGTISTSTTTTSTTSTTTTVTSAPCPSLADSLESCTDLAQGGWCDRVDIEEACQTSCCSISNVLLLMNWSALEDKPGAHSAPITDPLFDEFFDMQCLIDLNSDVLERPLDAANEFWKEFSGELRMDSLIMALFTLVGLSTMMVSGGVPHLGSSPTSKLFLWTGRAFLLIWICLQGMQVVFMILSLITVLLAYHSMDLHFSLCLRRWSGVKIFNRFGGGGKFLHMAITPTIFLQPVIFLRLSVLMLNLSGFTLATTLFSSKLHAHLLECERFLLVVFIVMFLLSFSLAAWFWMYSIPLIPVAASAFIPVLSLFGLLSFLQSSRGPSCVRDRSSSLAWMACHGSSKGFQFLDHAKDLVLAHRDTSKVNLTRIVYSALLVMIVSPLLILAPVLALAMHECHHPVWQSLSSMYGFVYFSFFDGIRMPDILSVIVSPPDFEQAMEWLASLSNYMEFPPADILSNSRNFNSIQMTLAFLRAAITYGNMLLASASNGKFGLETKSVYELIFNDFHVENYQIQVASEKGLAHVHRQWWQNKRVVAAALVHHPEELRIVSGEVRKDKTFLKTVLAKNAMLLKYVDAEFQDDRDLVEEPVAENGLLLEFAGNELKNDADLVRKAFNKNPAAIQHASYDQQKHYAQSESRNDVEAVLTHNGKLLEHAQLAFRSDLKLVTTAVNHSKEALRFATTNVVLELVKKNGLWLEYASETERSDRNLVMAAVMHDGMALKYATEVHKRDRNIVMTAVKQNGAAFQFAKDVGPDVVKEVLELNGLLLQYATEAQRSDRNIVMIAVKQNGLALRSAIDKSKDVVMTAVKQNVEAFLYTEDVGLVKEVLELNGLLLQYATEDQKNDREIVKVAVAQNGEALSFVGKKLREDAEIKAIAQKQKGEHRTQPSQVQVDMNV